MATLEKILEKDITRNIDGVIKADDEANIFNEVEEYVLTREISRSLEKVVEGYNEAVDSNAKGNGYPYNGVWISGYFGSGKSHLLKILSFILEDRKEGNSSLKDVFLSKISVPMFKANFDRALKVPSTSILFNIDQQADAARTDDDNAILLIFDKVFSRMQGYSGENRGIAEFERHLDEDGLYTEFKEFFKEKNGTDWIEFRSKAFGISRGKLKSILADFHGISPEEADKQIDHYKKETGLSVAGFAEKVKNWLDKQDHPHYRLNFFIDEVGQFIANRTRLMLQLQTVTETLCTVCKGRVWVFVTSQEDLNSVVGDPEREQTNDFSKIHARFYYRISLSSANVEEVIQKRLLEKKPEAKEALGDIFMNERQTFKTMFSFRGGWKEIHFRDKEQFVNSYPFQAYQFPLLQESLIGLSQHNAFMGRHVSRGERSMLEIFQDVAKNLKDNTLYSWATFDMMFEGIRNTLKTVLLDAVNKAENNLLSADPLAVRVLKVLLLVKYIREFKSTAENIQTLLTNNLDTDTSEFAVDVREALDLLLEQTYIQLNGNEYQYLTNEEQDIENEIKNTPVEVSEIRKFYSDFIFNEIIREKKIKYELCGESYPFKPSIDDELPRGTGVADLVIRIITPQHPHYSERNIVLNHAAGKKEMLVFLNPSSRFVTEMRIFHQTKNYTGQQTGHDASGRYNIILDDKKKQNQERKRLLEKELWDITASSEIYVMDQVVALHEGQAKDRIVTAFQKLVAQSYPSLRMIRNQYSETSLKAILNPGGDSLFDESHRLLEEDEKEMHSYIQRLDNKGERITTGTLYNYFSAGQYGWFDWAIACVCAKLYMRGTITILEGVVPKDHNEVFSILSRRRDLERYSLKLSAVIKDTQVAALKEFFREYFYEDMKADSAKDAGIELKKRLNLQLEVLEGYIRNKNIYPFVSSVEKAAERIKHYRDKDWEYYYDNLEELEETLLHDKVEIIDRFVRFMGVDGQGEQLRLWRELKDYYTSHYNNFTELQEDGLVERIRIAIESETPYKNNTLRTAEEARKSLECIEAQHLAEIRKEEVEKVDNCIVSVRSIPEFNELTEDQKKLVLDPLNGILKHDIPGSKEFSRIRDRAGQYASRCVDEAREKILELVRKEDIKYATHLEKSVKYRKSELADESDVLEYIELLKTRYLNLIKENKRIGL